MSYHSSNRTDQRNRVTEVNTPLSPNREYDAAAAYTPAWDTPSMHYDDPEWEVGYEDAYAESDDYSYTYHPELLASPHMRMGVIMGAVLCVIILLIFWTVSRSGRAESFDTFTTNRVTANLLPSANSEASAAENAASITTSIAPFFAPTVQYWEPQILVWASTHNLDPNLVATIMQIESCGDPEAVSSAGAQGLFQVMPFHFAAGEKMTDPETNALRGMSYLAEMMDTFNNNTGLAMAGYNGGPGNARKSQDQWPAETQRYYRWGTGIYADAQAGSTTSPTLNRWMEAGGATLCQQAAVRVGLQ